MAQMRQFTCCLINLAIALMALLRRLQWLTNAQISPLTGLWKLVQKYRRAFGVPAGGSLWRLAGHHVGTVEVSH